MNGKLLAFVRQHGSRFSLRWDSIVNLWVAKLENTGVGYACGTTRLLKDRELATADEHLDLMLTEHAEKLKAGYNQWVVNMNILKGDK